MRLLRGRRTESARRGVNVVEFAVVVPVFLLFIFGIVEISRSLMVSHLLSNAARDGCRLGILAGKSTSDITTVANNVLSKQGISGHTITVRVKDVIVDAATAQSGDEITVMITVPASTVSWLPGGQYLTGNLAGQYTLRRE